jgi:hypothetical protein
MVDGAMLEALYRHLSNEEVGFDSLLAPHVARCVERIGATGVAYAIHDTTMCAFTGSPREGLGRIHLRDQGFLAHVTLAVAADGSRIPLGLLGVEFIIRGAPKATRQTSSRKTRRDPTRESLRWNRSVAHAAELVPDRQRLIHVADREADIYRLLAELVEGRHRFIVRAAQDRMVELEDESLKRLFEAAREATTTFTCEVPVSKRTKLRRPSPFPARGARVATLAFATLPVRICRPPKVNRGLPLFVEINAVHVIELSPPPGQPPVEWLLLTSESVDSREAATRVIEGYRTRWTIEEYFKAVKTGCAYESRQLESFHALSNLFAYTLVIAYAMLLMRTLARQGQSWPATAVLSGSELKVLKSLRTRLGDDPSVRDALLAIAALGGHIKNNGDPGWQVLSRGWQRLRDLEAGYRLARGTK